MEFKDILVSLMEEKDISISKLAKATGISKSSLHGFINGAEPSFNKVKILAEFFGVSMDYMSTGMETVLDPFEQMMKLEVNKATYEILIKRLVKKKEK